MKQLVFVAVLFFQLSAYAQYQVQKGRWIISHQLGGYEYNKYTYKEYEDGVPQEEETYKNHRFSLSFSGPDWGSIEYYSENYGTGTNKRKRHNGGIYLSPEIGYFIRDNMMIGANVIVGFQAGKYDYASDEHGKSHSYTLGLGPMMKYYFGKNTKHKPFAGFESRFEFQNGKEKTFYHADLTEYKEKDSRIMAKPFAGYAWFLGKRWTVDSRIEYTYQKSTDERTTWYYENGVLATYSPETDKWIETINTIGLSFGVSYTF